LTDTLAGRIAGKAAPLILELGYELTDMEFVKEGANWYLRFFIEHKEADAAVTTDDCQLVSERLSLWLDEEDPIPQAYFLEVSSPGVERPLKTSKDFERFQEQMVRVNLFAPVDGGKSHLGLLGPVSGQEIILKQNHRELRIPREMVSGVHLYWPGAGDESDE